MLICLRDTEMVNKELQDTRMRAYFIDSCKAILKSEGIKAVSVRNVAKQAGYSYATLYHYFKNINDLVAACIEDFLQECKDFVLSRKNNGNPGFDKIINLTIAYMNYFVQYPGIYELVYLERIMALSIKSGINLKITILLDEILHEEWDSLLKSGNIKENEIDIFKNIHNNLVLGQMLIYLNRYLPEDYNEFIGNYKKDAELLFSGIKESNING
jgi:AcrR family transcriptional regulator